MRESHALHAFAEGCLKSNDCILAINLQECDYLDSTFLGCLVAYHKQLGDQQPGSSDQHRLRIIASEEKAKQLFDALKLRGFFHRIDDCPATQGDDVELPIEGEKGAGFGRHVMECHQQLAEVEGPNQAMFTHITKRLMAELEKEEG